MWQISLRLMVAALGVAAATYLLSHLAAVSGWSTAVPALRQVASSGLVVASLSFLLLVGLATVDVLKKLFLTRRR